MSNPDRGQQFKIVAKQKILPELCPHCHKKLSPWEQVLLNVDGCLICKNCWYRIHLSMKGEKVRKLF
jgi:hypothetical protein